jgi:hypothetical protein
VTLLAAAEDREARRRALPHHQTRAATGRVLLRCDGTGCTLFSPDTVLRFPDLQTALDCARGSRDPEAATIEVWQEGEYICCMAPRSGQQSAADFPSGAGPRLVPDSILIAAERHANRAARILMATAGPLFWLALLLVIVAASLGWRLLVL